MPRTAADTLEQRLTPTAVRIRTVGFKLIRLMTNLTGNMLTAEDVRHLTLTAAFEAFLELGGDPANPDTFAWDDKSLLLERRGLLWLKRETLGRGSEFGDISSRLTVRKGFAFVEGSRWDAWLYIQSTVAACRPQSGTNEYIREVDQERDLRETNFVDFLEDLRDVLDAQVFQWLVERYRDDVSQQVQVDRFVAATPAYQDAGGRKRAEDYINKRVSRARKRAAALLADKWAETAKDVTG